MQHPSRRRRATARPARAGRYADRWRRAGVHTLEYNIEPYETMNTAYTMQPGPASGQQIRVLAGSCDL
eukprot:COSAG02_NODE_47_length_45434_cov_101.776221_3_plen_68_part_00